MYVCACLWHNTLIHHITQIAIDDALLLRFSSSPSPRLLSRSSLTWDECRDMCDLRGLPAAAATVNGATTTHNDGENSKAKRQAAFEVGWWLECVSSAAAASLSTNVKTSDNYRLWWHGAAFKSMFFTLVGHDGTLPPPSFLLHLPALLHGRPPLPPLPPAA